MPFLLFILKGKSLFIIVLASMMIPAEATIIPAYLVVKELNWLDTYYGLIVPGMTSVFGIFIMRQFFLTMPKDYVEAAKLEGASHFKIYLTIGMPLANRAGDGVHFRFFECVQQLHVALVDHDRSRNAHIADRPQIFDRSGTGNTLAGTDGRFDLCHFSGIARFYLPAALLHQGGDGIWHQAMIFILSE